MHVLHVTPYYAPAYEYGGVVRAVEGMARSLVRRGHSVTILTTDSGAHDSPAHETLDGVRVLRVPNLIRRRANLSTPNAMQRIAKDLLATVDVIHCHEFRTVENLLVTPLAAQRKIPLILSPHGTLTYSTGRTRLKAGWDRLLSPAIAQRFDHVIALTQAEADEARALWATLGRRRVPTKFSVVPNGVDFPLNLTGRDQFRAKYGLRGVVCLFMGRLHARKNVDVLIKAFHAADVPDTHLLIVGPDEGMLPTITPLLDNRVTLTGYLGGDDRLAAFAASDVFALPADGEGLSMAMLEALAAGLPAILSPGCNLPEAEQYDAGVIVQPQVESLAAALCSLLTDSARRERMGANARRLVQARFTWDAVAEQLEAIYSLET